MRGAIEQFFFAYRGFTSNPDRILEQRGLGRVHHRVLYFVGRNKGITVSALLGILGVSKQALHAPLRQLVDLAHRRRSQAGGAAYRDPAQAPGARVRSCGSPGGSRLAQGDGGAGRRVVPDAQVPPPRGLPAPIDGQPLRVTPGLPSP